MKAVFQKIAIASTCACLPAASAVQEGAMPAKGNEALEGFILHAAAVLRPGMESFAEFLRNMQGAVDCFTLAGSLLWAAGTVSVVVGAMWLGRDNLAPLH